jgi:DNA-directed RNA polymerase specialized sigma24 family protein
MLSKVFKDHNKWINTTKKFGCTKQEAEDIVGDMYVIIGGMLTRGLNISYGNEVNYYYIYMTLRTTFLQLKKKQDRMLTVHIEDVSNLYTSELVDFDSANETVLEELNKLHWYDRKIYNLIQYEYTITELAKKTNISYHSIYNTYRKVKTNLKTKI